MSYRIQITVDGQIYPIFQDVAHTHPQAVHDALDTTSEGELQQVLDQCYVGDWYDEQGQHRGPDGSGLEMFWEDDELQAGQPFLGAAGSRETSSEIMQAILRVANGDQVQADRIWREPTNAELVAIIEIATRNGLIDSEALCWGAAGSRWAHTTTREPDGRP